MQPEQPMRPTTYLFTVRLWLEPLDENRAEWRGRIEYVLTGEGRYFRDWSSLIAHLKAMLPADRITE